MKKVAFYTLGCKLNFSETSTISRSFEKQGFKIAEFHDKPDIFIINTCSVTDHADKKCRKVVKEALKITPDAFVAIIGCYAQLKPEEISNIPGVDAVLGASEKFRLIELIGTFEKKKEAVIFNQPIESATDYYCSFSINDRTRTFLKVQDGCDYSCTFCTIPMARGGSRSDKPENIINSAKEIVESGVKEIVLTGVNIGDYGIINGQRNYKLLELLKDLDQYIDINRFRISSIEPNLLSDEIIEFVSQSKKFVPHFHIPLQSGSNKILKMMRRRYLRELYQERASNIRKAMPDCCIGVDVITGFPGETDEDFLDTYRFLNELDVSYLHVFTYSERDNTIAADMGDSVLLRTRHERATQLRSLSEKKKRAFYEKFVGTRAQVLFEDERDDQGNMYGFTENYIKVTAKYDPVLVNEIKEVYLSGVNEQGIMQVKEVYEYESH